MSKDDNTGDKLGLAIISFCLTFFIALYIGLFGYISYLVVKAFIVASQSVVVVLLFVFGVMWWLMYRFLNKITDYNFYDDRTL